MLAKSPIFFVFLALAVHRYIVLAQQLDAPAWPLAVKNPFLNTWYQAGISPEPLNQTWPRFWASSITGWYCSVVVDGAAYRLMGAQAPGTDTPKQGPMGVTPSQTTVEMQAGPVNVTMSFFSPITPTDLIRHSLPFSYFSLTVASTDGKTHSVKIYSDISAEWITGDTNLTADATADTEGGFVILQSSLQSPQSFTVVADHAQDATSFYALSQNSSNVTYQIGPADDIRSAANNATGLQDEIDPDVPSHQINNPFDVFGISADLVQVTNQSSPLVYAIGLVRDPVIQFIQLSGTTQLRSAFYRANLSTPHDMVSFFLSDFDNAFSAGQAVDNQIASDAKKTESTYPDLLSLVTRQAMGALEITVSKNSDGTYNTSDVMAFMKDMGLVGAGGVNSVDVMYAAFPMYLYLNPTLGGYLLKPLLVAQDVPQYTQPYAAQGLGNNFPNASVSNIPHNSGIEQSGNMLIMLLAHLQATGDGSLVNAHYNLIKNWANYLVNTTLNPESQQPSLSDGANAVNLTNLALKGIIGIGAMAKIATFVGNKGDASTFGNISINYIQQWQSLSISQDRTHILASFGQDSSSGLIYNLYADKLLQLDLVPESVYELQTSFYISQLSSGLLGIPLDSRNPDLTRADWMLFAAAASTNSSLRSSLITMVHTYVFTPSSSTPISPIYNPFNGQSGAGLTSPYSTAGQNSPSMGALFSVLALEKPLKHRINGTSLVPATKPGLSDLASNPRSKAGTIAGGVIGSVAGFGVIALSVYFCFQVYKRKGGSLRYDVPKRPPVVIGPVPSRRKEGANSSSKLVHRDVVKPHPIYRSPTINTSNETSISTSTTESSLLYFQQRKAYARLLATKQVVANCGEGSRFSTKPSNLKVQAARDESEEEEDTRSLRTENEDLRDSRAGLLDEDSIRLERFAFGDDRY